MPELNAIHAEYLQALEESCARVNSAVAALYRRDAAGGYAPVLWAPHTPDAAPPYVSSASDVAAYLRTHETASFQMNVETFRDGLVRRGLQAFGTTNLFAASLRGAFSASYYYTVATAHPLSLSEAEEALRCAEEVASRLITQANNAHLGTVGLLQPPIEPLSNPEACARILTFASHSDEFDALARLIAEVTQATGVVIEDEAGRVVARYPYALNQVPASAWLLDVARLPYLDWMERSHGAVVVPPENDDTGAGRVVVPLYDNDELLGISSLMGIDEAHFEAQRDIRAAADLAVKLLLQRRRASRSHILRRTLSSVENERLRVACELHDETSQNLVALKVRLATCELALQKDDREAAVTILEDCACIADDLLDGVNRLSADLRPSELNYLGLRSAIEAEAAARLGRAGIAYEISGNAQDVRFNALQESMLLAGVVEALSNCAKHAHATRVELSVDDDAGWLTIAVRDNGRGFDAGAYATGARLARHGLKTMRDCAEAIGGDFWVGSDPGGGTTVRFSVPARALEGDGNE